MRQLLTFEYSKIRPRPLGFLMVLGIFFLVMFLEILVGGIFYSVGYFGFKSQPFVASVIINLGLWATKGIILLIVGKLILDNRPPLVPSAIKRWVEPKQIKHFLLLSLLIIIGYRLAYDSILGEWIVRTFGIDETLTESMDLILQAPALGVLYLWVVAPIFEEIVYRGMIYSGMRLKGHGTIVSALIAALLFSIMHMNVAQSVNAFFLGLLVAFVYEATGNLSAAIWLHIINNVYVTLTSGFIDSGLQQLTLVPRIGLSLVGLALLAAIIKLYEKKAAQLSAEPLQIEEFAFQEMLDSKPLE